MSREAPSPSPLRVAQWVRIRWWNACAYYAVSMAEGLARSGQVSHVIAPVGTPANERGTSMGLSVPDLGDLGSPNPATAFRALLRTREFLVREKVDLVNVHSGSGHFALALLCRSLGIALVRTRGDIRPPQNNFFSRWLYRYGTVHHLISADFLRPAVARLGVPDSRITTLYGGTDILATARVDRARARQDACAQLGISNETFLVGMVARLSPVKGHSDLLRAVSKLAQKWPELEVALVGPDAQRTAADVEKEAQSLGIAERVHLVGNVSQPLEWSAAFDVAVIASTDSEAICRSAFEYLAVGTPILASDLNAIGEVLRPDSAVLFQPGDPLGMANGLERLIESPELRASLSQAGRARAKEAFSLESFGDDATELFGRLVRKGTVA